MPAASPTIPPDNPRRTLTLAQPDNLTHIGLVGDTYTITVTGEADRGTFLRDRYAHSARRRTSAASA